MARSVNTFPDPDMFPDGIVLPVGGMGSDWYTAEIPYTATGADLLLKLSATPAVGGDSTFLFDNVRLVPVAGGNNLVVNGDFEANADQWVQWPGYAGTDAQLRPFNSNGNNRTGIAFMQGTAQIEQEVSGLTVGKEYVLSLDFNARNCCGGGIPGAELDLDLEPLEDFPGPQFTDGQVTPAGGNNEWYSCETTFVAAAYERRSDGQVVRQRRLAPCWSTNVGVSAPETAGLTGDYNKNGSLDAGDLDLQAAQMVARSGATPPAGYDLNGDNRGQLRRSPDLAARPEEDLGGRFRSERPVRTVPTSCWPSRPVSTKSPVRLRLGCRATGTATSCSPAPTLSRPLPTAVTRPVRGLLT